MWNTPNFTFSSRFLRLSSSNGRAPWGDVGKEAEWEEGKEIGSGEDVDVGTQVEKNQFAIVLMAALEQKISLHPIEGREKKIMTNKAR